jgi:hypothetical protein
MHDPTIDSSAPLSDWFEGNTLCLRRQDKQSIATISDILLGAKPYVVVAGPGAGLISHYFELIYRQVKANDDLAIDVFLPATADGLLARFNDVLAELSVDEARQAPTGFSQRRILMLSESADLGQREWDLMARLLGDFPGANFGLLVFVDEPDNVLVQGFMKSMGSKLKHCALNFPNGDELQQLLESADGEDQESQVFDTLRRLGVSFGEAVEPIDNAGVANLSSSKSESAAPLFYLSSAGRKGFKQLRMLLLGLFVAVVVSVSVSLALNDDLTHEAFTELLSAWKPTAILQDWGFDSTEDPMQDESANVQGTGVGPLESDDGDSNVGSASEDLATGDLGLRGKLLLDVGLELGRREDGDIAAPQPQTIDSPTIDPPTIKTRSSETKSIDPVPQEVPQWLVEVTAKRQQQRLSPPAQKVPVTPQVVAGKSQSTVALDPAGYYIQFNAMQVEVNATRELERIAAVFDSHILRLNLAKGVFFVVVAGPYRTLLDATNAKDAANIVDVMIVQGAQLQRRQVAEPESNFER